MGNKVHNNVSRRSETSGDKQANVVKPAKKNRKHISLNLYKRSNYENLFPKSIQTLTSFYFDLRIMYRIKLNDTCGARRDLEKITEMKKIYLPKIQCRIFLCDPELKHSKK